MARPCNLERSVPLELALPESVRTKVDLLLWSEAEGRVPRGAYQQFFLGLLNDYFEKHQRQVRKSE